MDSKFDINTTLNIKKIYPIIYSRIYLYEIDNKIILTYEPQQGYTRYGCIEHSIDINKNKVELVKEEGDEQLIEILKIIFKGGNNDRL